MIFKTLGVCYLIVFLICSFYIKKFNILQSLKFFIGIFLNFYLNVVITQNYFNPISQKYSNEGLPSVQSLIEVCVPFSTYPQLKADKSVQIGLTL